jgi:hypothetical protein
MVAVLAAVGTAAAYGQAWRFDLQCDDLLVIRPWSAAELAGVWHGTWEPTHAFATFFRPLASSFYALTFELFGYNASAHMLLSLAMLATVTFLLALFVARDAGGPPHPYAAGSLAALVYLLHPNTPWSTGVWITNDFHKLTAISALGALLVWQRLRHKPAVQWLWLVPFIVVCFLVKEDGVMLLPALLSLQWARARLVGDVTAPRVTMWIAGAGVGGALVVWRSLALGELGGFPLPASAAAVIHNLLRGPLYALTQHGRMAALSSGEQLAAAGLLLVVSVALWLMPRERRFLPAAGLIIMFWYDLPLALISNVMRYYMLTIAAVMVLVPALLAFRLPAIARSRVNRSAARLITGAIVVAVAIGAAKQREELALFAPCERLAHECAPWVLEEVTPIAAEARAYVAATTSACTVANRPRVGDADTLTWGLGATSVETMTGERSHLVTGRVVTLVKTNTDTATFAVRHPDASAAHPVVAEFVADGRHQTVELVTSAWVTVTVPLSAGLRTWMRGAHRVDAQFSEPGAEWRGNRR